jgi:predicted nucleotidyltransferase
MNPLIENNKQKIFELCQKHHVKELYVFGSAVRNDFNENSDVDFLYEFDTSGIDFNNLKEAPYDYAGNFFDLKFSLEETLSREVDLLPIREIKNKYLKKSIDEDKILIYSNEEELADISY